MKLALLLFMSLGVTCASQNQTETTENDQTNDSKTPEEAQVGETRTSKAETPLVGSPTHGPESTTSNFRLAMSDFEDLIDLGRNLNPKNLSALETLNAFESFDSLDETLVFLNALGAPKTSEALKEALKKAPESSKAIQSSKARDSLNTLEPSKALEILKDLETLKYFNPPAMPKEALERHFEPPQPNLLKALTELRAFESFKVLKAAIEFLCSIPYHPNGRFGFLEALRCAFELPESYKYPIIRESLEFLKSPEGIKASKTLDAYQRALDHLKYLVKSDKLPKDLQPPKALEPRESSKDPKAYTNVLKFLTEHQDALKFFKPVNEAPESSNPREFPDDQQLHHLLKSFGNSESSHSGGVFFFGSFEPTFELLDLLKVLDPSEALETLESPAAFKAFGFFEALKNAIKDPKALSEALEFLNAREASDSQKARESLEALDSLLARRRALAGGNPDLVAEHENTASIIMTDCPALADAETTVHSALENEYYEVLRCLQRNPIWEDEAQELWYWAMIYGTPAWDKTKFEQQEFGWDKLWESVFKLNDAGLFERAKTEPDFKKIPKSVVLKYAAMFDSNNILKHFSPEMLRVFADSVDLISEYKPARIISEIISSVKDLHPDTSHIAPDAVKSIKTLQYLLRSGYKRIPKRCLQLHNGRPTVDMRCIEWLIDHKCILLLEEAVKKLLEDKSENSVQLMDILRAVVNHGYLDLTKWIVDNFRDRFYWSPFITTSRLESRSHDTLYFLRNNVTLSREAELVLVALHGDKSALQTGLAGKYTPSLWKLVARAAAAGGHTEIVKWIYKESQILPENGSVEEACKMGNFDILQWIFTVDRTWLVPAGESLARNMHKTADSIWHWISSRIGGLHTEKEEKPDYINAWKCLFYANKYNKENTMNWIIQNLEGRLLDMDGIECAPDSLSHDEQLKAVEWIDSKSTIDVKPEMMLHAAASGNMRLFRWLQQKGTPMTVNTAKYAAAQGQFDILKEIHASDQSLACTVEFADDTRSVNEFLWKDNFLDWKQEKC